MPNNQKLCSGDNKHNLKKKNKEIKTSYFIFIEIINTAPMPLHPSVLLSSNILLQTGSVGIPFEDNMSYCSKELHVLKFCTYFSFSFLLFVWETSLLNWVALLSQPETTEMMSKGAKYGAADEC